KESEVSRTMSVLNHNIGSHVTSIKAYYPSDANLCPDH
ncbi:unnamed protein product, partial [Heterotrigona itama]